MLKKMISRIILSVVMMFTILFQGAGLNVYAAGTPREVSARVTSFKILDKDKREGVPIWFTDYFYLSMDWDASGNGTNLKEGDYFDITLPDKMKFPSDTTKRDFDILGEDGTTVIAKAHVTPGPNNNIGGKVRVTFTNWVEGRENVKGNIFLASKFQYSSEQYDKNNTYDIVVNGQVKSVTVKMIGPHIVSDDELLAKYGTKAIKWENGQNVVIEDQAEWYVRVNYRQAHLVNAVITDHLTGGAGNETYVPGSFKLYQVRFSNTGDIDEPRILVDISNKLTIAPDKKTFTLNLGEVNGTQYRLVYKTTYTPGTKLINNVRITANNYDATTHGSHQSEDSGGTGTGNMANKIKLIKVDADDNSIVLKNAVFEVTKPDGSKFELTTGADGTITSSPLVSGTYKIKEKTAPAGYQLNTDEYTLVVSPTSNAIQTVKDEPIRTSVKATKQWVGPIGSAVTVHLYADDVDTGKTVTLNAANNWEDTFTNLRKYKPGTTTEIKYTVKEDAIANYNGVVSGDMATGFTITNTNTEKTTVKVTKTWVGTPAASATVKLLADGAEKETVTLTAADNWTHTFSNLPKYDANDGHEIVYTIDEVDIANYVKAITGSAATGFVVTNTITGKLDIPVTKTWLGTPAASVTIKLFADGTEKETVTLTATDNWTHTFTNLDKYAADGHEIVYTVDETPVAGYTKDISGTAATGFTIKNTNTETINIPVTKTWVGTAGTSATIKLLADGAEKETVTLTAADNWTHTFSNLPKFDTTDGHEIVYTVDEVDVPNYTKGISGTAATGFTVTNTITGKVSVPVTKVWVGPQASSAKVTLFADGVEKDSVTLNATNGWAHTFTNLDKYNNGTEIVYTVTEEPIANYDSVVTGDAATGFKVTNTNTEKTSVDVTKTWVGTPAASVTIKLFADGIEKETVTLTAADNWTHTFANLDKYAADGHEIVYTVDETPVTDYIKAITGDAANGFTITNTITGKVNIPVTKVWVGPEASSAKVTLYADGVEKDSVTLNAANNWVHVFSNLDKYNNGTEIVYTVTEEPIANYDSAITGDVATGFTVTNTNTEKVAVDVTKNWVGPATDSVTIKLLADGAEVESAVITAAENWMHTFSNLPKYAADGHEIVYTVDEYDVPSYVKAIEGTSTTGFTVTNTITGKVDIPVTKVWVGPATDSVTVNLYADGVKVDTVQLTAASQWKHIFANLDKYENGREIVYTVDEVLIPGYKTKITGDVQTGFTITNSKETPKTADHVNPMAYASIFVISLMAAIITMIEKKKFAR
ncbi:Cna B-type domain-containing protein [uncultured Solobacterium sp.]|uniref:Cna B-type domain-containing protein n=1 Tax=uncultured Solobacterium sp. TaxID=747375 RepID=UPI0028D02040|nr:Cna B-type domain-containing protein [uncultured Solobacterium sp.]